MAKQLVCARFEELSQDGQLSSDLVAQLAGMLFERYRPAGHPLAAEVQYALSQKLARRLLRSGADDMTLYELSSWVRQELTNLERGLQPNLRQAEGLSWDDVWHAVESGSSPQKQPERIVNTATADQPERIVNTDQVSWDQVWEVVESGKFISPARKPLPAQEVGEQTNQELNLKQRIAGAQKRLIAARRNQAKSSKKSDLERS